jgi:hypothetical protein
MSAALDIQVSNRLDELAEQVEAIQGVAYFRIGEALCEAQSLFRRDSSVGGFEGWVEQRLKLSRSTAYNAVAVFKRFGANSTSEMEALPKRVLIALAAPSTPQSVVDDVLGRAKAGEAIDPDIVADLKRQLVDAKDSAKDAKQDVKVQRSEAQRAKDERDRVRNELDFANSRLRQQAEEIERLKQDGVIHVYPPEPKPAPEIRVVPPAPKPGSCLPAMAAIIADGCRRDVDELVAMAREEGYFDLAAELEALTRKAGEAA